MCPGIKRIVVIAIDDLGRHDVLQVPLLGGRQPASMTTALNFPVGEVAISSALPRPKSVAGSGRGRSCTTSLTARPPAVSNQSFNSAKGRLGLGLAPSPTPPPPPRVSIVPPTILLLNEP